MFGFKRKTKLQRAVRRGAKLLDETTREWFDLVDPNTLDMSETRWCVVGQLSGPHGGYLYKLAALGLHPRPTNKRWSPVHFGFDITVDTPYSAFAELNELWCAEIHRRRIARVGRDPVRV